MRYISKYSWVKYNYNFAERSRSLLSEPWMGGVVLLFSVVVALLMANLPATEMLYHKLLNLDLTINLESKGGGVNMVFPRGMTVETFINDALMVIFFFGVGLEIKRELRSGELSSREQALLPAIAAVGGMVLPALIYMAINRGTIAQIGWGIPTATDIAFAIGIISLLGSRVPLSLKIFLTALAIVDDLGAILVIAFFYGGAINIKLLLIAVGVILFVYMLNYLGERRVWWYVVPAIVIWTLFYYSGIHATLSGVIMALLIPSQPRYSRQYLLHKSTTLEHRIHEIFSDQNPEIKHGECREDRCRIELEELSTLAKGSVGMSHRLEGMLSPYITFLIMPIFAFANAGVKIDGEFLNIFSPPAGDGFVGMGIFFGLVVGKPLGIWLFSRLAVWSGVAKMPEGASWWMLFAVACFGGIGFTMSLFVDNLAFAGMTDNLVDQGKIAILMGSLTAALLGVVLIYLCSKKDKKDRDA